MSLEKKNWENIRIQATEVAGGRQELHGEGLRKLCSSTNTIRGMKCSKMRWVGHAPRIETRQMHIKCICGT
jgi:hypothetical protein